MKKRLREPVSGLTHLAGVLLAAVGLVVLLAAGAGGQTGWWPSVSSGEA